VVFLQEDRVEPGLVGEPDFLERRLVVPVPLGSARSRASYVYFDIGVKTVGGHLSVFLANAEG
jgi:hypothetical protein